MMDLEQDNFEIFKEYINKYNKIPSYDEEYKNVKLGVWFSKIKYKSIDNEKLYNKLCINDIVKNELDNYYKNRNKNINKLNFYDKLELFIEYTNNNIKPIRKNTIYRNVNIGEWFYNQRKHIIDIDDDMYKLLCVNDITKNEIDNYLKERKNNIKIKIKSIEEKKDINSDDNNNDNDDLCELLIEYYNKYNEIPNKNVKYKNKSIGIWFSRAKSKIRDNNDKILYKKLCNGNEKIKEIIDDYLKVDKKCRLSYVEYLDALIDYINEFKKIPSKTIVHKDVKIGKWFIDRQGEINNVNDDKYIKLCVNDIIKNVY